ncbi:zinc ribbon domain-containing protein [Thermodesulfobacteriota bacterium]
METADFTHEDKITCPKCGEHQPYSDTCAHCGLIFEKYKGTRLCPQCSCRVHANATYCSKCGFIFDTPVLDRPKTAYRDNIYRALISLVIAAVGYYAFINQNEVATVLAIFALLWMILPFLPLIKKDSPAYHFIAEGIYKNIIIAVAVIVLSLAFGKISVISIIFPADHEILFQKKYENFSSLDFPNRYLYEVTLANTGKYDQEKIRLTLDRMPYYGIQVYWLYERYSTKKPLEKPVVKILCKDNRPFEVINIVAYPMLLLKPKIGGPLLSLNCLDPCFQGQDYKSEDRKTFEIDKLYPEESVKIGFVTATVKGVDPKNFEKVKVDIEAGGKIRESSPRITYFIRTLGGIFDPL